MPRFLESNIASSAAFSIDWARLRVAAEPLESGRITPTRTGVPSGRPGRRR
jgi:hypothetical protein